MGAGDDAISRAATRSASEPGVVVPESLRVWRGGREGVIVIDGIEVVWDMLAGCIGWNGWMK